jgi:hypothetical protein
MAFMLPYYEKTHYAIVANEHGETDTRPLPLDDLAEGESIESEHQGIIWRLSAPGYLDCTDWSSAESLDAAMLDCMETYDVCPYCGELLPEDDSTECEECGETFPVRKESAA